MCWYTESREKARQHGKHTISPSLVDGSLLPELLCQVVKPFQPTDFIQQPFFIALLSLLQVLPPIVDVLWRRREQRSHRMLVGRPARPSPAAALSTWTSMDRCCVCVSTGARKWL